jgi:hypothetical protein
LEKDLDSMERQQQPHAHPHAHASGHDTDTSAGSHHGHRRGHGRGPHKRHTHSQSVYGGGGMLAEAPPQQETNRDSYFIVDCKPGRHGLLFSERPHEGTCRYLV